MQYNNINEIGSRRSNRRTKLIWKKRTGLILYENRGRYIVLRWAPARRIIIILRENLVIFAINIIPPSCVLITLYARIFTVFDFDFDFFFTLNNKKVPAAPVLYIVR